jgi:hypothetical protein
VVQSCIQMDCSTSASFAEMDRQVDAHVRLGTGAPGTFRECDELFGALVQSSRESSSSGFAGISPSSTTAVAKRRFGTYAAFRHA